MNEVAMSDAAVDEPPSSSTCPPSHQVLPASTSDASTSSSPARQDLVNEILSCDKNRPTSSMPCSSSTKIRRLLQLTMERRLWSQHKESSSSSSLLQSASPSLPHSFDEYHATARNMLDMDGTPNMRTQEYQSHHKSTTNKESIGLGEPSIHSMNTAIRRRTELTASTSITIGTNPPSPNNTSFVHSRTSLSPSFSSSLAALRRLHCGGREEQVRPVQPLREYPPHQEKNQAHLGLPQPSSSSRPFPDILTSTSTTSSASSSGSSASSSSSNTSTRGTYKFSASHVKDQRNDPSDKKEEGGALDDSAECRHSVSTGVGVSRNPTVDRQDSEFMRSRWKRLVADRFQYHYHGASSLTSNHKSLGATRNPTPNTLLKDSSSQPHSVEPSSSSLSIANPQILQELDKLGQRHLQQQQHSPSLRSPRVAVVTSHFNHQPQDEKPQNAPSTTTASTTHPEIHEGNFLIQLGYLMHGDNDCDGGDRTRHGDACRGTRGAFPNGDPEMDETSQDVSSTFSSIASCPQEFSMAMLEHQGDSAARLGAHECGRKDRTRERKTALSAVTTRGSGRRKLFVAGTVLVLVCTTVFYMSWWYGSILRDGGPLCSWWMVKQQHSSTNQCSLVTVSLWHRLSAQVATKGMTLALRDSPRSRQSPSPYQRTIPFVTVQSRPRELLMLTMECYFFVKKSLELLKVSLSSWNKYLWANRQDLVKYWQGLKQDASSNTSISTTVGAMRNRTTTTNAGAGDRRPLDSSLDVPVRFWEIVLDDVEFLNDVALQCDMSGLVGFSAPTAVAVLHDLRPATPEPDEIQSFTALTGLSSSPESIGRYLSNHSQAPRIPANMSTGSERPQTTPILLVGDRRQPHFTASNTRYNFIPPLWLDDVDDFITRRIPESFHEGHVPQECEIMNLNRVQRLADGRIRQTVTEKKLFLIREAIETMSKENDDNHVAKFFRAQKHRLQGFLKERQIGRRRRYDFSHRKTSAR